MFTHPVGCSRLLSAVNDLTATNQKFLKVDTSEIYVKKRHNGVSPFYLLLFTCAQLRFDLVLIVMSSTKNRSTVSKMCWMKKTTDAIAGIVSKESVRVALLQTLGEDGVIWSTLR